MKNRIFVIFVPLCIVLSFVLYFGLGIDVNLVRAENTLLARKLYPFQGIVFSASVISLITVLIFFMVSKNSKRTLSRRLAKTIILVTFSCPLFFFDLYINLYLGRLANTHHLLFYTLFYGHFALFLGSITLIIKQTDFSNRIELD